MDNSSLAEVVAIVVVVVVVDYAFVVGEEEVAAAVDIDVFGADVDNVDDDVVD